MKPSCCHNDKQLYSHPSLFPPWTSHHEDLMSTAEGSVCSDWFLIYGLFIEVLIMSIFVDNDVCFGLGNIMNVIFYIIRTEFENTTRLIKSNTQNLTQNDTRLI